jgi:phage tail sheath protein FI
LTVTEMGTWRNTTLNANTSRAALYADWLEVYDNYNDRLVEVPPSGYVAGLYAYNDYVANDAYAPAGLKRGNLNSVCDVTTVFTAGEMETLYSDYQINPIRYMPEGIAVWGQKTLLTTPGNLDRINVRRAITGMELAISSSLKNYVFEPNDTFSRLQITQMIESYMAQRKADRAVQEYLVVCDDTNNSDSTIDAHELHVDIYVKPQQVAEFIQLRAIITRTGASFTELVV